MIYFYIWLVGFVLAVVYWTVNILLEKKRFEEERIPRTTWGAIFIASVWWPLYVITLPFEFFDKKD